MIELIYEALTAYIMACVIVASSLFEPFRLKVIRYAPKLRIGNNKHFIECRMCVGFWAAVLVCNMDYTMILPVYGLSYFLATQER